MKFRKIAALSLAAALAAAVPTSAEDSMTISITVDPQTELREISPYIYGVNSGVDLSAVSAGAFRLGGNRMSCYNWENNMSNAGSDWYNSADMHMVQDVIDDGLRQTPGGAALNAAIRPSFAEVFMPSRIMSMT